jgi:hypothetical protein
MEQQQEREQQPWRFLRVGFIIIIAQTNVAFFESLCRPVPTFIRSVTGSSRSHEPKKLFQTGVSIGDDMLHRETKESVGKRSEGSFRKEA